MATPARKNSRAAVEEARQEPKHYRLQVTRLQILLATAGLLMGFTWMFVFGVLVGRGLPLTDHKESSLRNDVLRFLTLDREQAPPPENAAETWETPEKMLASLTYFQDLTQTGEKNSLMQPVNSQDKKQDSSGQQSILTKREKKAKETAAPERSVSPTQSGNRVSSQSDPSIKGTAEYYTLLVGSLKEISNAQNLMRQLREKGYETRIETLELRDSGRWNRVLVGTFKSREAALKFAADFNRNENMQGLVIRESQ